MSFNLLELFILLLIISDFILAVFIFLSNKKTTKREFDKSALDSKFLVEQAIANKVSIRLITSIGVILVSLLSFFGYKELQNIEQRVQDDVVSQISKASHVSIEELKNSVDTIRLTKDQALEYSKILDNEVTKSKEKGNTISELAKLLSQKIPTQIFIVDSVLISKAKHRYYFNELRAAGGLLLPKFTRRPLIYILLRQRPAAILDGRNAITEITNDYIDFSEEEKPYLDLMIISR